MNLIKIIEQINLAPKTSFIGLRGYTDSHGQVTNQTILVGINYNKVKKSDLSTLIENREWVIKRLRNKFSTDLIEASLDQIQESLTQESKGGHYEGITKGIKVHKETGELYVHGLVIKKNILDPGYYPESNKKEISVIKDKIHQLLKLKLSNYRVFKLDKAQLHLNGIDLN